MLKIARKCVPFTPYAKDLSSATVTLVCATGVFLPNQQPFPADPGDVTYRVIPRDFPTSEMRIVHQHYDHSEADTDPNIVFPLETLRELAAEGVIRAVSDEHYSFGFTSHLKELYEQAYPEVADRIERSKTKLVLLMAGCPETCHRAVTHLAREIESRGVPTVIISASPTATESARPPRAMTWQGVALGRVAGRAGDREQHKHVVRTALQMFTHDTPPGRVVLAG